ncbi:glycosyltransferase [Rhizobium wenxiniae]|uniref:glycosyltransferase n=1 Tax=Rhizobium wenxiniae TaxID=1737357 RepID=UPI001C6E0225
MLEDIVVHPKGTLLHLALISPPFKSHIAVFETVGAELVRRGHSVTFVLNAGAERYVAEEHRVCAVEGTDAREMERVIDRASRPSGLFGVLRTVHDTVMLTDALCEHAPEHLRALSIDAVLGDQMEPAAGLLARHLGVPIISIACALPIERDETIPLPFLPWLYDPSPKGIRRNRGGERVSRLLLLEQNRVIRKWSRRFGFGETFHDLQSCLSDVATIAQTTVGFDFPRASATSRLHMVGPLREEEREEDIPFDIDPAKPFVFMSLGTLQGHRRSLFAAAARVCRELDVQLLVAHCGGLDRKQAEVLGATWVVDFAPQRAVLARADLCITHCGMNTVMDALEFGTPLLALPIAFDQPGVSARIVHHGVGLRLSTRLLKTGKMERAIGTLLSEPGYKKRAGEIGRTISAAGGLRKAADIIEAAII